MRWVVLAMVMGSLSGCTEEKPVATGPTVHCFNELTGRMEEASPAKVVYKQDVSSGKVTVTCPTGE